MQSPLVWITRAEPGAAATGARLADRGFAPLLAPLIATRRLPLAPGALTGVGALAFTSATGVRALCADGVDAAVLALPVLTVGDATAEAARAAGFASVTSAKGAGPDLAKLIVRHAPPHPVAVVGALEPAFDLDQALSLAGVSAHRLPVYETLANTPSDDAVTALREGRIGAILVHSPAAARALAHWLAGGGRGLDLTPVRLGALSLACAGPLAGSGFGACTIATEPTEAALLDALQADFAPALGKRDARS